MYKIKPSLLDSYRIYKLEIFEKSLDDILKQIRGEYEPKPEMDLGSEIHKYFETGKANLEPEELTRLECISQKIPKGFNEFKMQYEYNDILFSIVIDRLVGKELHEFKTGSHFHGVDFYDNSLQWKIYLLCTGCPKMTYHVITYNSVRPYTFKYHEPFSFFQFRGMEKEIMEWSDEFIQFCQIHNVEQYIRI